MGHLPIVKPKDLVRALLRADFYVHHQTGSHARLFHRSRKELRVTIPIHNQDLPIDTLKRVLKQADLEIDELNRLL